MNDKILLLLFKIACLSMIIVTFAGNLTVI